MSDTYQPHYEELVKWATPEVRQAELLEARSEFFKLTGEVFDDDRQLEMRMASFLEHYVFDRVSPNRGKTPARELFEKLQVEDAAKAPLFEGFTQTMHGLFEVRKLGQGFVRVRELFDGDDHEVTERRMLAGLNKGDIVTARLIPHLGSLWFSAAFVYHPPGSFKSILKEVKRRRKQEPARPRTELIYDCARRSLKADRYRQIAIEKIYDFVNPTV
ncbi:MAG: hypothetical protein JNK82_25585 [Myxococcaceae bacterium]|nr:hypothetical protein [Myxococcaceae bacterium]